MPLRDDNTYNNTLYGSVDRMSMIDRLDPSTKIPLIIEQLLGIRRVHLQSGSATTIKNIRYNKPTFTEEFIRQLEHSLYGYVNTMFNFSKFDEKQINMRILHIGENLNRLFGTHGNDNFISDKTWAVIMKIHDKKVKETIDGKEILVSGWHKLGIKWEYNEPVTMEMLENGVKDFDEICDQDVIMGQINGQIRRMIETSYKRSSTLSDELGMMTSVLKNTSNETNNMNQTQQVENNQMPPPNNGGWS